MCRLALISIVCSMAAAATAHAQSQTAVSLPWALEPGSTNIGAIVAQNYPPINDSWDVWAVEDFVVQRDWLLEEFSYVGQGASLSFDVVVEILDALPPGGRVVLRSTPGSGACLRFTAPNGYDTLKSSFNHQRLHAGQYYVKWYTTMPVTAGFSAVFLQGGPYAIGSGLPDTSWRYYPNETPPRLGVNRRYVGPPADGILVPTGVNFILTGIPLCEADTNGDQGVTVDDLVLFLQFFAEGDTRADLDNGSGTGTPDQGVTIDDLTFFLQHLIDGC